MGADNICMTNGDATQFWRLAFSNYTCIYIKTNFIKMGLLYTVPNCIWNFRSLDVFRSRSFLEATTTSPLWLSIYMHRAIKLVNKPFDDLTLFDHVLHATSEQTLLVILHVVAKRFNL